METFLQLVANDLRNRFQGDLSQVILVFPNKRAALFFNDYWLTDDKPSWAPQYTSISELFEMLAPVKQADSIETVCRIFEIYKRCTGNADETLDSFYGWGERLLSDFQDIDKAMAPAQSLLANLRDIKKIESTDVLTERQVEVIKRFFANFNEFEKSTIRQRFLQMWNEMYNVYSLLNQELASEGYAYEGALQRLTIEKLEAGELSLPPAYSRYVFIGFNVLQEVEKRLFKFLYPQHALFYWDYDTFYVENIPNHEAGYFMRQNLALFPNALPAQKFSNLLVDKDIEFVSSTSDNAAARSASNWLSQHTSADERRTAIVLCNETLLQPLLHSLPDDTQNVNITKGFPLHHTSAFSDVEKFFSRHAASAKAPLALLHGLSLIVQEKALLATRRPAESSSSHEPMHQLAIEAYFTVYTIINRLRLLIETRHLELSTSTLHRLMRQILRSQTIPFHGEPAQGLQIMGLLETRGLDFDNVLILSASEGILPARQSHKSFIPHDLRSEFGLSVARHRVAVYSYNFYRLLQRARHIRIVYNNSTQGAQSGEMSRFMTSLLVDAPTLRVRHLFLDSHAAVGQSVPAPIPKPSRLFERVVSLSPSAINTYFECPRRFYLEHIEKIRKPDAETTLIENNTFGTLFHRAAELAYLYLSRQHTEDVTPAKIEHLLSAKSAHTIGSFVSQAFSDTEVPLHAVVARVIEIYLRNLLRVDQQMCTFRVVGLEQKAYCRMPLTICGQQHELKIGGVIDRLDMATIDGQSVLRVVDYKTGREKGSMKGIAHLFSTEPDRPSHVFQTFLYSLVVLRRTDVYPFAQSMPVMPALFYVGAAADSDYRPSIADLSAGGPVVDFKPYADEFQQRLNTTLSEIFDESQPFVPRPDATRCRYCDLRTLCFQQ